MPAFKNKEEYQKWKDEKLQNQKDEEVNEVRELSESQTPSLINCPACKNEISKNAQFCPKCGEPFSSPARPRQRLWSPGIAALLSLIFPGAGQIYKGDIGRGFSFLALTAMLIGGGWAADTFWVAFLGFISYIVSIVDATKGDPTKEGGL